MAKNNIQKWFNDEISIFVNIPIRWHLIMLSCGIGMGIVISLVIRYLIGGNI
jgi:hypothetical protein